MFKIFNEDYRRLSKDAEVRLKLLEIPLTSEVDSITSENNRSSMLVCFSFDSAGVGRTGVFCALSVLIERLKAEAVVDVFQTVKQLRAQRPAMVQTKVTLVVFKRCLLFTFIIHLEATIYCVVYILRFCDW